MKHDPHSKNPVHREDHPHHLPHVMHKGGKIDHSVVEKALKLEAEGVLGFEMVSETPETDKSDLITVRRTYLA